jgi:hypothetical protein
VPDASSAKAKTVLNMERGLFPEKEKGRFSLKKKRSAKGKKCL